LKKIRGAAVDPSSEPMFPALLKPGEMRVFVMRRLESTITVSERLRQFFWGVKWDTTGGRSRDVMGGIRAHGGGRLR